MSIRKLKYRRLALIFKTLSKYFSFVRNCFQAKEKKKWSRLIPSQFYLRAVDKQSKHFWLCNTPKNNWSTEKIKMIISERQQQYRCGSLGTRLCGLQRSRKKIINKRQINYHAGLCRHDGEERTIPSLRCYQMATSCSHPNSNSVDDVEQGVNRGFGLF